MEAKTVSIGNFSKPVPPEIFLKAATEELNVLHYAFKELKEDNPDSL